MTKENRSQPCWQTLKLMLSSLIVFNFYLGLSPAIKYDYSLLLNIFNQTLIPMLIFITAYTTKNITWNNFRHHLIPAVITYVTFQIIDSIPHYLSGPLTFNSYLLFPPNGLWFFLAMPIWQFVFLLFPSFKKGGFGLLVILIASLAVGFIANYFLMQKSALFSIISYLPFCIMAYFCNEKRLLWIRQQSFIVILPIITLTICYLHYQSNINDFLMSKLGLTVFTHAFLSYVFSFLAGIALGIGGVYVAFSSVLLTKIATNALGVFLIHPIVCFSLLKIVNFLGIKVGLLSVTLLTLATIIISLLLAMIPFIHWLINPTLSAATLIDKTHGNT